MKICAALAFYDEPVTFLERCISSLEGICDEIVALDGAWEHFEGGNMSPLEQEEAIWRTSRAASIKSRVSIPHKVWESQVHKRQRLMEMASENADWIFVIDGDEYVTYSEAFTIKRDLKATEHLCAYAAWKNLNQGETMPGTTLNSGLNRRLFKAGTTVKIVHSGYFYGKTNVLTGEALDLRHCLAIEHDNANRGVERNERAREYRRARERHAVENWVTA